MRLTIERMRTMVLVAAVLLVVTLGFFLSLARWKNRLSYKEMLKPLGANIQQEANGVTYTQSSGGHTLFKLHASKVEELKKSHRELLHDVAIDFYGADGKSVDRIEGKEFEYDQESQIAIAHGTVEITLMRPGEAPAIAPKAISDQFGEKGKSTPLSAAAQNVAAGQIHVETSGLTFDRKSGMATTEQHVDFSTEQGSGDSVGASYNSDNGLLVLEHAVNMQVHRGPETVQIHAHHAEFERGELLCHLTVADANYRGGQAQAGKALILFRDDGSAVRLNASDGFAVTTSTGAHLTSPEGVLDFDEHNQPTQGHLAGGVKLDSSTGAHKMRGESPTADLAFDSEGQLKHAHLERGVTMHSDTVTEASDAAVRVSRDWRSPVTDIDFRNPVHGQVEVAGIRGTGGVVILGETQRGSGPVAPSRLAADEVTGEFGPEQALTSMTGVGHASLQQTTAAGARQQSTGDRIEVHFVPGAGKTSPPKGSASIKGGSSEAAAEIQSASLVGNVVLIQDPAQKAGAAPQSEMRATAGRADYEGAGEWLHLTQNPRVDDGELLMTADKLDVSQASGDAFAHGNVKATWNQTDPKKAASKPAGSSGNLGLGGDGPAHVVSAEAQLKQATGEATFSGKARLWQQADSVAAPVIVLDRVKRTLVAQSTSPADPVRVVLLSAGGVVPGANKPGAAKAPGNRAPSVIRVRGSDLKYSDAERKAVMHGGQGGVLAETATATTTSNNVELFLLPPGNHAGNDGQAGQVDRLTANGNVTVSSGGRKGSGEKLVYTSDSGNYVLTGSAAAPPKMADPVRGMVTGESLIFNSRDDSVSIEGGGQKTTTDTRAPK